MKSDLIQVAFALDDRFAEMTCVSIASLLMNTTSQVVINIIEARLSDVNISVIKRLISKYSHAAYQFYHIDIDDETYVTAEATKVTKETYAKAMLPELLAELDYAIWLDGDTVIEGDIAQLWQIDLGDAFVGMVADCSLEPKERKKLILCMNEDSTYYNTGVILMNLSRLRSFQLSKIVEDNVGFLYEQIANAGLNWYAEQDMLNYALRGKVYKLQMRFNSYFWMAMPLGEDMAECIEAYLNPVIVHFLGTPKPTELGNVPVNLPEWERYYKYKAISPYASDDDAEKIAVYKMREANSLNAFVQVFDGNAIHWYSFHFAKQMFELAVRRYESSADGKNIVIWGLNNRTWTLAVYLAAHGLGVNGVVDGFAGNQGISVFDYVVSPPEVLQGCAGETYVMLDMRNYYAAQQVMETLRSWGYAEDGFCFVFAPIWEGTGWQKPLMPSK